MARIEVAERHKHMIPARRAPATARRRGRMRWASRRDAIRRTAALGPALCLSLVAFSASARPLVLRLAYSTSVADWADPAVMEGTIRSLVETIVRRERLSYEIVGHQTEARLIAALRTGAVNLAWLSPGEYVRIRRQLTLAPVARAQVNGAPAYRQLLLVRRRAGLSSVGSLKGRRLSYFRLATSRPYLEVLLGGQSPREPDRFFGKIVERSKPQSPILDVLLGEAEGCLALDWTLAAMTELNPQLKRDLVALRTSEPLPLLAVASPSTDKSFLDTVRRLTTTVHQTKQGRELLLIFRIDRLLPARDSDFDSVRRLLADQRKAQGGAQ